MQANTNIVGFVHYIAHDWWYAYPRLTCI